VRAAPLGQRVFAAMVDTSAVLVASATFALIFVKITGGMPESKLAPVVGALVVGMLWAMYQYMFIVYAGTTPGLQVSGLALRDFSGEHLRRLSRRNRAIGMVVAALPLGLGFVWAVLDEDALCWHDRMSHSYVVERGH
jgi:RDD family.